MASSVPSRRRDVFATRHRRTSGLGRGRRALTDSKGRFIGPNDVDRAWRYFFRTRHRTLPRVSREFVMSAA